MIGQLPDIAAPLTLRAAPKVHCRVPTQTLDSAPPFGSTHLTQEVPTTPKPTPGEPPTAAPPLPRLHGSGPTRRWWPLNTPTLTQHPPARPERQPERDKTHGVQPASSADLVPDCPALGGLPPWVTAPGGLLSPRHLGRGVSLRPSCGRGRRERRSPPLPRLPPPASACCSGRPLARCWVRCTRGPPRCRGSCSGGWPRRRRRRLPPLPPRRQTDLALLPPPPPPPRLRRAATAAASSSPARGGGLLARGGITPRSAAPPPRLRPGPGAGGGRPLPSRAHARARPAGEGAGAGGGGRASGQAGTLQGGEEEGLAGGCPGGPSLGAS